MLRSQRRKPSLRSALPSVFSRYSASLQANSSTRSGSSSRWRTRKSGSAATRANLFQGHTSWQSSQPKIAVADGRAELLRDRAVVLDREVGNAAARIELVRRRDRAGRAGRQAGAAAAAAVLGARVDRQWQVGVELAQHEERARALVDEVGVLADPAEPGIAGQRLFHHRARVDEGAMAERRRTPPRAVSRAPARRPRSTL